MLIVIEDHVIPTLLTSAIEAYEFEHKTHVKGRGKSRLETFGLLWGYVIPEKNNNPAKIVATIATVETSALRHEDWVEPDANSILAKKKIIQQYWPHLELVGSFHSHPYNDLDEANSARGWLFSEGDRLYFPSFHKKICPEQPYLAHVVVAITELKKSSNAVINSIRTQDSDGVSISADYRKFWLNSYMTEKDYESDTFSVGSNVTLDVSAIHKRFLKYD